MGAIIAKAINHEIPRMAQGILGGSLMLFTIIYLFLILGYIRC